jgi:nitrate reductase beta subunit
MKVRAQIGMVLNLDKCIGCHTCSVTCKNVWTSREGVEYAWFNNVETKPGIGYPKEWENQKNGMAAGNVMPTARIHPKQGSRWRILANIFGNPNMPEIDDYYEPFTFDYDHLQKAPEMKTMPTARPSFTGDGASAWKKSNGAQTGKKFWALNSSIARKITTSRH